MIVNNIEYIRILRIIIAKHQRVSICDFRFRFDFFLIERALRHCIYYDFTYYLFLINHHFSTDFNSFTRSSRFFRFFYLANRFQQF